MFISTGAKFSLPNESRPAGCASRPSGTSFTYSWGLRPTFKQAAQLPSRSSALLTQLETSRESWDWLSPKEKDTCSPVVGRKLWSSQSLSPSLVESPHCLSREPRCPSGSWRSPWGTYSAQFPGDQLGARVRGSGRATSIRHPQGQPSSPP